MSSSDSVASGRTAPQWAKETWEFLQQNVFPEVFVKRRLNFITIHYIYVMGMSIILSVIIFGIGDIPYIDALFFASGSCTQSGLNTIDVNNLHTSQQVMLYLGAMFCNPIIVHSAVVFVRLYWFEKRFKDVVRNTNLIRRTRSRARTETFGKDDLEQNGSLGVRGRAIRILRNNTRGRSDSRGNKDGPQQHANGKAVESSNTSGTETEKPQDQAGPEDPLRLQTSRSTDDLRLPQQLSPELHIRFLENQRNPSDTTALRIPSPREFERGGRPQNVNNGIDGTLLQKVTSEPDLPTTAERRSIDFSPRAEGGRAHITIDEPRPLRDRNDRTTTFPRLNTRQSTQARQTFDSSDPGSNLRRRRSNTFRTLTRSNTGRTLDPAPYLSWQPTIGRNSLFVGLTEEQREELGGIEYRALKTLALILVVYFFAFHILGIVCMVPWILNTSYGKVVTGQGQGRVWWGFFTSASAFNDLGFTLTRDSMISFGNAIFPMLLLSFLIIIGNTGFPCMLRLTIWLITKFVSIGGPLWEELRFLLDHPRRCFTLLFPGDATWWLFAILVVLNAVDLIFFIILDLNDPVITKMSGGIRFVDGLFQAASTRTAGFAVVSLSDLHPAIQVSYLIMMYISVFPIAISMRRTNVYEEKSLGIYGKGSAEETDEKEPSYVGAHLRRQLSFDLWYVFLGMFIIAIVEGGKLENTNEYAFTLFSVLFEIVSAYGTVGLSLGYPGINASFSAKFRTLSKLIIIAMQIRGRHRGLPYELDRAILLPSESLQAKEAKEAERMAMRVRRRSSGGQSMISAVDGQMEGRRFRPETGLSSGTHAGHGDDDQLRARANTNRTHHSTASGSELPPHHGARHGLGAALYKLTSEIDSIKEESGRILP
ncbi:hypothetical protein A1O1_02268 [Capronia coronata CBS 617.96]|uniref:Potassium transport protein n=1 Tax=Capronia coronata CBS 617.96 TaxID=1182541 RepID=W9YW47_9EURO|nr:uncharacterized protein A1O1_02268 [Capronia coronata CBS 617.96]EXJ93875.1 hypothetical protein A1O1_02268 [Capronia coronata CBS 617.96]